VKFKVSGHTEQVGRNFISAFGYYLSISGSLFVLQSTQSFMCSRHEEAMFVVSVTRRCILCVVKYFRDVIQEVCQACFFVSLPLFIYIYIYSISEVKYWISSNFKCGVLMLLCEYCLIPVLYTNILHEAQTRCHFYHKGLIVQRERLVYRFH